MVGDWADAELWDGQVKEPVNSFSSFLFEGEIQVGTPLQDPIKCIFDSSVGYTAVFGKECTTCA